MADAVYLQVVQTANVDNSVVSLTNNSGGTLDEGAVCVVDTTQDESFTTTTTADSVNALVLLSRTADAVAGLLAASGKVKVQTTGVVAKGDRLVTSTTAGKAKSNGSSGNGFAVAVTADAAGSNGYVYAVLEKNVAVSGLGAGDMTYTPADVDDWGGVDPGNVDDALDYLAGRNEAIIGVVIGDGANAIDTSTVIADIEVPADCTVKGWTLVADASGSIVVDVWKDSYANYPPTVADTIAGSEKPTLSSAQKNQDITLTTWTTALSKGDWLKFKVDSASTVKLVSLMIRVEVG